MKKRVAWLPSFFVFCVFFFPFLRAVALFLQDVAAALCIFYWSLRGELL